MVVTTTRNIDKTVLSIKKDFPYTYKNDDIFAWSSNSQIIRHPAIKTVEDIALLLHEIAHAELGHTNFSADIELLSMETAAWQHAQQLIDRYRLAPLPELIEESLDSYRMWHYQRSLCPTCGQTGLQTQNTYRCINCRCSWRANDARVCRLQRIRLRG